MTPEERRAAFRAKFPDLAAIVDRYAALYGPGRVKLKAAINVRGDEVGAVDDAFRERFKAALAAPEIVVTHFGERDGASYRGKNQHKLRPVSAVARKGGRAVRR